MFFDCLFIFPTLYYFCHSMEAKQRSNYPKNVSAQQTDKQIKKRLVLSQESSLSINVVQFEVAKQTLLQ